ncbi:charged multivesicular body protein 3 [Durotheca rogersii]|uniref:charged multivesicular body protein 3 n=1 Tax=Durotheca rogersii TaxID=419775 RepID=UPI00221F2DF1|nr:charged multivesicular body protein 3 [Durotheca rogersii]KAI5863572.1 charged multivesicular body protein 3 [Durotheca rogersii]
MENLRAMFVKPDPKAQLRKCNALIRSDARKLDRDIVHMKQQEARARNLILEADKRAARDPQRQAQARRDVRVFAQELIRCRKMSTRLVTSKAQLSSVQMQVNEAFALQGIEGSIRVAVGVMRDVNLLIRVPQLAGTMQELSKELTKAGIIEEMVGENLPDDSLAEFEEETAEEEVDKVLREILEERIATTGKLSNTALTAPEPVAATTQEKEEEDTEAMMGQMRNRLEALRS